MTAVEKSVIQQMEELASSHGEVGTSVLRALTGELLHIRGLTALSEYNRFNRIGQRSFTLPDDLLKRYIGSKRIVVTGGTGCIGSALIQQLMQYGPARVVSVSRNPGVSFAPRHHSVEYRSCDIRSKAGLQRVFDDVQPDLVYHLAAQRDPGAAETNVASTLATNITGVLNVIACAKRHGSQVVYASTGKALRPFTPDVYAATKIVGEWLFSRAASDIRCSGTRFTHVVDNSIIHNRLVDWISRDEAIRLHGTSIMFYMQSAVESAQLLLCSGLDAEYGTFTLQAINNLDMPIDLLDLALGALVSRGRVVPIRFVGLESGYEKHPYPALYDHTLSGELSPLINGLEAPDVQPSPTCNKFDRFPVRSVAHGRSAAALQDVLDALDDDMILSDHLQLLLERLCWELLDARLPCLSATARKRAVTLYNNYAQRSSAPIVPEHARLTDAIVRSLAQ